jgi:Arc/MetJ-type ribon-helix-helix transcriptional regulator
MSFTDRNVIRFTDRYTLGMSPLNVKLEDRDVARLDDAIARGFAVNRSDAMRIALRSQLHAWDQQAWDDAWARAVPDESDSSDEFADLNARAVSGWADLDGDK